MDSVFSRDNAVNRIFQHFPDAFSVRFIILDEKYSQHITTLPTRYDSALVSMTGKAYCSL